MNLFFNQTDQALSLIFTEQIYFDFPNGNIALIHKFSGISLKVQSYLSTNWVNRT